MALGSMGKCSLSESSGSTALPQAKVLHCPHSRSLRSNKELTFFRASQAYSNCFYGFSLIYAAPSWKDKEFEVQKDEALPQVTQPVGGELASEPGLSMLLTPLLDGILSHRSQIPPQ